MESDSFIFDDDIEEIGSDVEAFCPKCKADTAHTIITKYEDEIRRVQCSPCGDVHAYRKPRGELVYVARGAGARACAETSSQARSRAASDRG